MSNHITSKYSIQAVSPTVYNCINIIFIFCYSEVSSISLQVRLGLCEYVAVMYVGS